MDQGNIDKETTCMIVFAGGVLEPEAPVELGSAPVPLNQAELLRKHAEQQRSWLWTQHMSELPWAGSTNPRA
jgi:hypothetical protein